MVLISHKEVEIIGVVMSAILYLKHLIMMALLEGEEIKLLLLGLIE